MSEGSLLERSLLDCAAMESARGLRLPRLLRLGLLLLAVAYAPSALGDFWYKHWDEAKKALETQDWERAIEEIQEALERKGDSGVKVRTYGLNFTEYFPHLKLGIAYYELGELESALQAFETEEVLGAIADSEKALIELRDYRQRARRALAAVAEQEQQRIRQIVDDSLRQAGELAESGQLSEAMVAVGRALAVAPEDAEALATQDDLRTRLARQEQDQQVEERASSWVSQGRDHLTAGRYGEASSAFRKALDLRPSDEVRDLLATAQERLRAALEQAQAEQDAAERAATATSRLRQAADFESAGDLPAALELLQSVLALDPSNAEALVMQRRVLAGQSTGEQEDARRRQVERWLQQSQADFDAQKVDASLAAANRVLALDPDNELARQYILRAYRSISQGLLGRGRKNLPPAIRFTDLRQDSADGSSIEQVERAHFQLVGVVIDESPVTLVFSGRDGSEIPGVADSKPLGEYTLTQFTLNTRLRPGSSVLRLTATDQEGLSSSSEYAVAFSPPLSQRPWFQGAVAGLLAVAVSGFFWRRRQRRQRLLKRRFNPYIAGAPVLDEKLFIGRDRLIDRILQTVHNNSLLLYGERRIGKTSLQHHLKRRLQLLDDPEYDFFPVYIDLQGTPQEKFFATLAEDTFHELAPVLEGLEPTSSIDQDYSYRDLVRDLRNVLKALAAKSAKKVKLVLLIDEVDELNEYDPKINQRLRSLFMKSFAENLVSVVSGVAIKKQWQREGSPWYNFFEEIEVKPFRREDAVELVERPIKGIFKTEDGVVDHIIELTDCKPYLIQKLCIALVNRLHEQDRRTITVADVEAIGRPEAA
ncbi:MAG: AAA family ATPase [bacterium]|nr:AAA family ATPase [bacterium]